MIYIDDSGHPQSGTVVYGWIEFSPDRWADILKTWLDTRKRLWRDFGIPVTEELHTTQYANGRGRISKKIPNRYVHNGVEYWKDFGRDVAEECLDTIRCTEGLTVGAVWRKGHPENLSLTRHEAYVDLISKFEHELTDSESLALVFVDGDGSDPSYRAAHRELKLADRRVIEDAIHLDSGTSQLVQMADLVAWSANARIDQHRYNEFAWNWYVDYLSQRDPARGPQEI